MALIDADGYTTVFAGPKAYYETPLYFNDVAHDLGGRGILVTEMGNRSGMMRPDDELWPLDSQEARNIAKLDSDKPLTCWQATIVPALGTIRYSSDW